MNNLHLGIDKQYSLFSKAAIFFQFGVGIRNISKRRLPCTMVLFMSSRDGNSFVSKTDLVKSAGFVFAISTMGLFKFKILFSSCQCSL
jgi:hypothetical protein